MLQTPCYSGESLTLLAATTAITMAKGLSIDELNVLGNFLNAVADNLSLIASQKDLCCDDDD